MSISAQPRKRTRWWPALIVLVAEAGALAYVQLSDDVENWVRFPLTMVTLLLACLLLALWFMVFTRFPLRTRLLCLLAGVAVAVGGIFGFRALVRMEGSRNGSGVPNLVWQWAPKKDADLPPLTVDPATVATITQAAPGGAATDFPEFLGRARRNVVTGIHLDPDWVKNKPKELWRRPIGPGWSSYAIVGPQAITQEQRGQNELVVSYELKTGKPIWTHSNAVRFTEMMGGDGPRATPTVSDGRVYAIGATGILDCLEVATGNLIWSRNTLQEKDIKNLEWGKSSSPLVFDDRVVVSGGMPNGPCLLAFDKNTGKTIWEAGSDKSSYSSPVLATLAGVRQVVSVNAHSVTGHDPTDGHVLWEYSWPGDWAKCSQPVVLDKDRVFVSAGYGIGCALLQVKAEDDKKLSVVQKWKNKNLKTQFTNVAVFEGMIYGLDDGILTCLDPSNGQRKWKDGRYGSGQVLLVDDLLLIQAEKGFVVLVEASPKRFKELARLPALSSKTWNNPALAGDYLLVRNDEEAACYQLPLKEDKSKKEEKLSSSH